MFLFYSFRHYLLKIDMRQKVTKFKYKGNESFPKHLLFLEYILLYKKHLSLLVLVHKELKILWL